MDGVNRLRYHNTIKNRRRNSRMEDITIVVVPFPAQGHLNQLLHLSLRLSATGLSVHFASSASHNRQAKHRLQGWNSNQLQDIEFHNLEVPPFPAPPPDPNSTSKFPTHLIPAFHASIDLRAPLGSLLRSLSTSCRRLAVIHDPMMPFASHEAASIANGESYQFQCVPTSYELSYFWDSSSAPDIKLKQEVLDVIQAQFDGTVVNELWEFVSRLDFNISETGTLYNACRAMEGEFFDLLAQLPRCRGKKLFAVGPLNPTAVQSGGHECLKWLDNQPPDSVVYVSFGTTSTFSDEQIKQLAIGLKGSEQRFIWVLREADRGDIFAADGDEKSTRQFYLPPGFEEEIQGVGIVVRGWAPQLEILAHPSAGAFVSHCGWNSCMESLSMGVPIIAWPMHSDQPRNAKMVTEYLKAGIVVRDWDRREEVISGGEVEEVIKRMMVYDQGKEIRKRAKCIGEDARLAVSEGGSSKGDMDSFISHISRA